MSSEYRNNHYVPEWYQGRFITGTEKDRVLYYLDLNPGTFLDPRGISHPKKALFRRGPDGCFVEEDLYTTYFSGIESTDIEKYFFGQIDTKGRNAIDYLESFAHPSMTDQRTFFEMMTYLSSQKLRTPKGLHWLSHFLGNSDRTQILRGMTQLQSLFCAIWTECVWQIADASQSETKFIISDHPVTVYNRCCGPRSPYCKGPNDPDIRLNATHTIFPLSLEKVLILTNLTWARNPYQSELGVRPNPTMMRSAIFSFMDIQTNRHLDEQEVKEINFIIKKRAYKYIAAGKQEWLYPERHVSVSNWHDFGKGYLLMPDPRSMTYTSGIMWGGKNGPGGAMDEYGRVPGQEGFDLNSGVGEDWFTMLHFQGEFAQMFGPKRRGRAFNQMILDPEEDDEEYHKYHLGLINTLYGRKRERAERKAREDR